MKNESYPNNPTQHVVPFYTTGINEHGEKTMNFHGGNSIEISGPHMQVLMPAVNSPSSPQEASDKPPVFEPFPGAIFEGSYLSADGNKKIGMYTNPETGESHLVSLGTTKSSSTKPEWNTKPFKATKSTDTAYSIEPTVLPRKASPSKGNKNSSSLRDKLFIDLLGFPEGDSPKQVVITDLYNAARSLKTLGHTANYLAKEAITYSRNNTRKVLGAVVLTSLACTLIPSHSNESIANKHTPKEIVSLPMQTKDVSLSIKVGDSINDLADTLHIGPEKMAVISQHAGIHAEKSTKRVDLKISLPVSNVRLHTPATIAEIADRFQLPETIVRSSNPESQHTDHLLDFTVPGRAVILTNTPSPNLSAVSEALGLSVTELETLNQNKNDGMIIVPTEDVLTDAEASLASIAASAPIPAENHTSTEKMSKSEYIQWLADQVEVTPDDYDALNIDTSHLGVFDSELPSTKIVPKRFVGHWTGNLYPKGVDQFVSSIKGRTGDCCSVMFYIDKDAKTYRFVKDPTQLTAHALNNNMDTQGVEIEARNLRDYTPAQMKQFITLAYGFMRNNGIPIERKNFVGHEEIDAAKRGAKHDMPKDLVDALFPKLKKLADDIASEEADMKQVQDELATSDPKQKYDKAMERLLGEISSGEGGWDSVNTGRSGDTKVGGARYNQLFKNRMLSELTIAEILAMQKKRQIFAVGRYQFITNTLHSAVSATHIDVNRKFDQAAQNELAVNYLIFSKRKHLAGYIKGEDVPVEKAITDLCQEWASMPCNSGHGYYDHDRAGNRGIGGKRRVEINKAILNALRSSYIELHTQPSTTSTNPPTTTSTATSTTTTQPEQHDDNGGLSLVDTAPKSIEPFWMKAENAEAIMKLYFSSSEECKAWLLKQTHQQDADGSNTQVLIDMNKLPNQGEK